MTDYFALLQLPRNPWLDPDELKARYQELTLATHPDRARANDPGVDFATVTEGYRVLSDHKLRIQHLLKTEGHETGSGQDVPAEFIELFSEIARFLRTTDDLLQRTATAQNALSKSLLREELLSSQKQGEDILARLTRWHANALDKLSALNEPWTNDRATAVAKLSDLQQHLAYLTRWLEQMRERQFQLSQ